MNNIEMERHFQLSNALVEHLIEEINLYAETNDLELHDILYVINKIFTLVLFSNDIEGEEEEAILYHFSKQTREMLIKLR